MRTMTLASAAATCILCGFAGRAGAADPHPNGLVGTSFPADRAPRDRQFAGGLVRGAGFSPLAPRGRR